MKLHAKMLHEYFIGIDEKNFEFRQFESITLEDIETHETRTFLVEGVRLLDGARTEQVKQSWIKVPWDPELPIYAIKLGLEIGRTNNSVPKAPDVLELASDRKFEIPESERTWHGVGD